MIGQHLMNSTQKLKKLSSHLKKTVQQRKIAIEHMRGVQRIMKYHMKIGEFGGCKSYKKLIVTDIKQIKECDAHIKKLRLLLPVRIYPA